MRKLGVQEAAAAIRGRFYADRSTRGNPENAHRMKFAKDVDAALGGDGSPDSVQHTMVLLREEGIDLHAGDEFPKYATRKWDRTAKVVHDADEEHAWINEEQPAPADPDDLPPARTLEAPVQDLSVDLRDKVPHMVGDMRPPHPTARIPSAITNREAAQDAHARQPSDGPNRDAAAAAYDEANPGLNHQNQDAAHGEGEFVDHNDVHVEDVDVKTLAPAGNREQGGAPYLKPAAVGVMAHDDPDGDGIAGQDTNPTHDSILGTDEPQRKSGDSSAGKTDTTRRPVGNRRPM